ncbi:hypothetical protein CBS101457_001310 [Exobasidium rhododendri]|nr:hypothetical protein CBS101457_001310 [Exobasidium rhododendri]
MSKDLTHVSRSSLLNLPQSDALKGAVGVTALYIFGATHVAPYLSQENGLSQRFLLPIWLRAFSALRLGTPVKGKLPIALLVAGAAVTFIFTAVGSVAANAAGNKDGYNNTEPRIKKRQLTGVVGRFASTHDNLLEFFSAFAAAAILATQYDSKGSLDNQLVLIATVKYVIFPISYYADLDILRTVAHVVGVGGVVNTLARIAFA